MAPVSSRANPRVRQLRAAFLNQPRLSGGLIAVEGEHLLLEALRAGVEFRTIFIDERRASPDWLPRSVELLQLTPAVFGSVVDTQTPQGIAALIVPPRSTLDDILPASSGQVPLVVVAAGLQDPGNLGTVIRSAHAFAVSGVLTTPGTVSPWNQKAMRASAGSVFHTPTCAVTGDLAELKARGLHLFAAVADTALAPATPLHAADLTRPCALLIGNEGAGIPPGLLALADTRLTIPTPGGAESLNAAVAASIILYEASRQRAAPGVHGENFRFRRNKTD